MVVPVVAGRLVRPTTNSHKLQFSNKGKKKARSESAFDRMEIHRLKFQGESENHF